MPAGGQDRQHRRSAEADRRRRAAERPIRSPRTVQTLYSSNAETWRSRSGSAFKLGILKALRDEIDAGAHKWDEVVTLGATDISLPSGVLQNWPVGSPFTLHTLAGEMISISDNTAADALLRVVGRDKVEAALGHCAEVLITTRELFTLEGQPRSQGEVPVAADAAAKRAVLATVDAAAAARCRQGGDAAR